MPVIDYVVLIVYLVAVIAIGVIPGRIRGREAFLISDRRLGGLSSGFTIAASKIGGGLLVTYSTLVFAFGVEALWLFVGYLIGYALFYIFARRLHAESHEHQYYTMADFFQHRYGRRVATIIGVMCAVSLVGWIFTNLIAGGQLIASITKFGPVSATALMAATTALYLVVGGFHAVVRTDVLQYFALFAILAIITVVLASGATPDREIALPSDLSVGRIISFILIGALFPMGSAELWQRAYAARSPRSLLVGISVASISFLALGLSLSYVCLRLRAIEVPGAGAAAELGLVAGVAKLLGPGLTGLWIIAFMSAIVSSADTFIFTTASAVVQDVMERVGFIPQHHRVRWMRAVICLLAAIGLLGAIAFKGIVSVTFFFAGITMSLGAIALMAWIFPRIRGAALGVGLVVGFTASVVEATTTGVSMRTALLNLLTTVAVASLLSVVLARSRRESTDS